MPKLIPEDQYTVERKWHQYGEKYFPCITIVLKKDDGQVEHWPRILSGQDWYRTSTAAQDAAETIQIEGVYDNKDIKFRPSAT